VVTVLGTKWHLGELGRINKAVQLYTVLKLETWNCELKKVTTATE
jgi:hypothetical protein